MGDSPRGNQGPVSGANAAIQMDDLIKVKGIFERHEGGLLRESEFVWGMKEIFDYMDESHLTWWFTHVDVAQRGLISWRHFMQHLMEESAEGGAAGFEKQFTLAPNQNGQATAPKRKVAQVTQVLCPSHGPIITLHDEGEINVWNQRDYTLQCTVPQPPLCSISDARFLHDDSMLLLSTYDRMLTVYNCGNWHPVRRFFGARKWSDLPARQMQPVQNSKPEDGEFDVVECLLLTEVLHPVTAIECISHPMDAEWRDFMLVAQQTGMVHLYSLANLNKHNYAVQRATLAPEKRYSCHSDAISRMLWCDALQGFITSSWDSRLYITELETGKRLRTLASDGHEKSVFYCDYCPEQKLIASCGADKDVLLWNPHMDYSVMRLSGHLCSLQTAVFNFEPHQLVTLAADQTVKLWDLRVPKVLQTILEKDPSQYSAALSAIACDKANKRVIVASTYPQGLVLRKSLNTQGSVYTGHSDPLVGVACNPDFEHIVTVDARKAVVWDCKTGERLTSFYIGEEVATACFFDSSRGRLLIGHQNGSVGMWNYVCGQPIKRGKTVCQEEVSAICLTPRSDRHRPHYTIGSYRRTIIFWRDTEGVTDPVHKVIRTDIDISCVILCPPLILAAGMADGSIVFYNCNSFQSTFVLRRPKGVSRHGWDDSDDEGLERKDTNRSEDSQWHVRQFAPSAALTDNAVEAMAFLAKQQVLVSVMGDGFLHFWDAKTGQLLLLYGANYFRSQAMFVLGTDAVNQYLFVADDQGLIFVYDVANIPCPDPSTQPSSYVRGRLTRSCIKVKHYFRAYKASVLSLEYLDRWGLLVTSCADSSAISLWTIQGGPVGQFGQTQHWDLDNLPPLKPVPLEFHGPREMLRDPMTYRLLKPRQRSTKRIYGPPVDLCQSDTASDRAPAEDDRASSPMRVLDGLKLPTLSKTGRQNTAGIATNHVTLGHILHQQTSALPDLTGQHHLHRPGAHRTPSALRSEIPLVMTPEASTQEDFPAHRNCSSALTAVSNGVVAQRSYDTPPRAPKAEQPDISDPGPELAGQQEKTEPPVGQTIEMQNSRRWFERMAQRLLQNAPSKQPSILLSMGAGLAAMDARKPTPPSDLLPEGNADHFPPPPSVPPNEMPSDVVDPDKVIVDFDQTFMTSVAGVALPETQDAPCVLQRSASAPPAPGESAQSREKGKVSAPKPAAWAGRASSLLPLQKLAPVTAPSKSWSSTVTQIATKTLTRKSAFNSTH